MNYELIIVGAGPAGLSAALTGQYLGLKTLIIESASAGGALTNKYPWKVVENYIGFNGMKGLEIAEKLVEHVKSMGIEIKENETVRDIKKEDDWVRVITNKSEYASLSVILAIGLGIPQKIGVNGEDLDGVVYSLPNPMAYKGQKVVVVGGGDSAIESAIEIRNAGADITLVHRKDKFRTSEEITRKVIQSGIRVMYNTEVKEISGDKRIEKVIFINKKTEKEEILNPDVIFVSIGTSPNMEFLYRIGIQINEKGSILIDESGRTNIPGIFAAGDVVGKCLRIPQAVGEGSFAGINAFKYVKNPYWE